MYCQAIKTEPQLRKRPFTVSFNISESYSETILEKIIFGVVKQQI